MVENLREDASVEIKLKIVPPPSGPICDFCSDPEVYSSLPCESFTFPEGNWVHESLDHWAACKECDRLIREEKWEELLERSITKYKEKYGFLPPGLKKSVRGLHRLFRAHRKREA